jgi:3-dehydroquinate dehydratase type I
MKDRRICAVITQSNADISQIAEMADLYEVRIDLIGRGWEDLVIKLPKPWIACNRRREEDGNWQGSEDRRVDELLTALPLGADIIDIELATPGIEKLVAVIKTKAACLISSHNFEKTPQLDELKDIVLKQIAAGADICKVVTFADKAEDNLTVLRLIHEFPSKRIIAFAMGEKGLASRILCPLMGGDFSYASIAKETESAKGQQTVKELYEIYRMVKP